jgi:N-acetylglucosamine kinase-like BadF-type ATPase
VQYVIGIDGGGTKTRGVLSLLNGKVIADVTVGPSNYQIIGSTKAQNTFQALLDDLTSNINKNDIQFIYFGLSGADLPSDFETIYHFLSPLVGTIPHVVENDTWCVFRSALQQQWGVVSLYGTGSNAGAVDMKGEKHILRALGYAAGGSGGGDEIAMTALHYAFRADEGTYKQTSLSTLIPSMLGLKSMSDVVDYVYPTFRISEKVFKLLPPIVFEEAGKGDAVCEEILTNFGRTQGEMVKGMLIKANLTNHQVPVVLGGSVYKGSSPHFLDAMMNTIKEVAPLSYAVKPDLPPVAGSVLYALEKANIVPTDDTYTFLQTLI